MTIEIGNGSIPLRIGNLIDAEVYGGPYRDRPQGMFCVKMAAEIDEYFDADIPTQDFNVPAISDLRVGIMRALMAMTNNQPVYVGCMGGIGRTGLFLAALAKIQIEYRRSKHRKGRGDDPVGYVRQHFIPHAVETEQQKQFIADLDVSAFVEWVDVTQRAMGLGGMTPPNRKAFHPDTTVNGERIGGEGDEVLRRVLFTNDPVGDGDFLDLIERDLDWVDSVDADSAEEYEPDPSDEAQWLDVYEDLDDLDVRLKRVEEGLEKQVLTNATIFEKIRMWLR